MIFATVSRAGLSHSAALFQLPPPLFLFSSFPLPLSVPPPFLCPHPRPEAATPLSFSLTCSPPSFPFLSLFPLDVGQWDPLHPARGMGSAVSSPSGVWGGAPAEINFGAF